MYISQESGVIFIHFGMYNAPFCMQLWCIKQMQCWEFPLIQHDCSTWISQPILIGKGYKLLQACSFHECYLIENDFRESIYHKSVPNSLDHYQLLFAEFKSNDESFLCAQDGNIHQG